MKPLWIVLCCASTMFAQTTPREIVRQSLMNYLKNQQNALQYSFVERAVERDGDTTKVTVSQVVTVDGTPVERLISRDGRSLPADVEEREKKKIEKREHESSSERAKRLNEYQHQWDFVKDVPDAYNFKIVGEELIDGRSNYVIDCTPNPNFVPHYGHAKMFSHIEARLYVDKEDLQWTRADAKVIDTISFGLILARIGQGAHVVMEQTRINDALWLTKTISVNGSAKIMLVGTKNLDETVTYSDFHRQTPDDTVRMARVSR